jgi:hydroxymethylglutaryl-CoA reductase
MAELLKKFSKLDRDGRIKALEASVGQSFVQKLDAFVHPNSDVQNIMGELSENYLSNFMLPFGVVPNVLVNGKLYAVPVVVEESSVVAAASKAASFWAEHGGFEVEYLGTTKKGQVHFIWNELPMLLSASFEELRIRLLDETAPLTTRMNERGGGISGIELRDCSHQIPGYFQLDVSFETVDAMGANFINSVLEQMAISLQNFVSEKYSKDSIEVVMSILSNYTPESAVKCSVSCPVDALSAYSGAFSPNDFARRFVLAVQMAKVDVNRAVTHNKGIYNGIDAVVLATGNDWRAVEAAGHAFASRNGSYASLSHASVDDGLFTFTLTVPMALGTVGGLTQVHPLSKLALIMLGNPSAKELMALAAAVGLANNFSAVASLVTSGIQKGHMKLHLVNILNALNATEKQRVEAQNHFANRTVSYSAVADFLKSIQT